MIPIPATSLIVAAWALSGAGSPVIQDVDKVLRVHWKRQNYNVETGELHYFDGVKAMFGPTTIESEELIINSKTKEGHAIGSVVVTDSEGTVHASNLDFNWDKKTGEANDVTIDTQGAHAHAKHLKIQPGVWVLEGVYATGSDARVPDLAIRSKRVEIRPGQSGVARNPSVELFGRRIITLPTSRFSLDRRVEGFKWPAVSYRRGAGLGFAWSSGFLLTERLALNAQLQTFPKSLTAGGVTLAHSWVKGESVHGFLQPQEETGERFANGYLDSVNNRNPGDEDRDIRAPRATLALESLWNQSSSGRLKDANDVTKQLEVVAEFGKALGGFGVMGSLRGQSMRAYKEKSFRTGAVATGTLQAPVLHVGKQLELRARLDGYGTARENAPQGYRWGRGSLTLVAQPIKQLRLGVGSDWSRSSGIPTSALDPLAYGRGYHMRGDLLLGPLTASVLLKYGIRERKWYDTEWSVSLVSGSFEPYFVARLFPRDIRFGVRFRIQSLAQRLQERDPSRTQPAR